MHNKFRAKVAVVSETGVNRCFEVVLKHHAGGRRVCGSQYGV